MIWPGRIRSAALAGGLAGLLLFGIEGLQILQAGAIGLNFDTQGPFAAVFAAIRPELPGLLARVLVVYVVGGVWLGLLALLFGSCWNHGPHPSRWKWIAAWVAEFTSLSALAVSWAAVHRPALFDDLGLWRPWLLAVVNGGAPLWVGLVGGAFVAVHFFAARRFFPAASRLLVVLGIFQLCGWILWSLPRRPVNTPRVVLIGVDALRTDRLKAYGGQGAATPNLDQFFTTATRFDNAWVPLAQTEPAWRALLTARWPSVTGVREPLTPLAHWAPLPTFPRTLTAAGWRTTFETDCSRFNFQPESSGFSERVQPPRGALNFALEKMRFRAVGVLADNALGAWWLPEFIDNRALAGIHDPHGYVERLAQQLVRGGPSLFAWHATAAHFPGDPSWPQYRRFVRADAPLERRLRMVFTPIAQGAGAVNAQTWGRADSEALYDELIAQADAQVGVLFDALKKNGLYDDALIIVFSDHGESFHADQPQLGGATPVHGARLGAEENRVVLGIKLPGARKVDQVGALVRLIDLGPTILEWAKEPPLTDAEGRSLLPLLEGRPDAARWLYAETGFTHASPSAFNPEHAALAPRTFDAYSVRADGIVEMSEAAHAQVLAEKDFGAFDGTHWLVRSPLADGGTQERCDGNCEALSDFLGAAMDGGRALGPP